MIQRNGEIVVGATSTDTLGRPASGMLVERLRSNGALDRGFGSGGRARSPAALRGTTASSIALAPGGKVVAAGSATGADGFPRAAFVRFTSRGRVDISFGARGDRHHRSRPLLGGQCRGRYGDGRIAFAGSQRINLQSTHLLGGVLRSSGSLGGSFTGEFGADGFSAAVSLTLAPGGKVLAAGSASDSSNGAEALSVRMNSSGSLDRSFG